MAVALHVPNVVTRGFSCRMTWVVQGICDVLTGGFGTTVTRGHTPVDGGLVGANREHTTQWRPPGLNTPVGSCTSPTRPSSRYPRRHRQHHDSHSSRPSTWTRRPESSVLSSGHTVIMQSSSRGRDDAPDRRPAGDVIGGVSSPGAAPGRSTVGGCGGPVGVRRPLPGLPRYSQRAPGGNGCPNPPNQAMMPQAMTVRTATSFTGTRVGVPLVRRLRRL